MKNKNPEQYNLYLQSSKIAINNDINLKKPMDDDPMKILKIPELLKYQP